MKDMLGNEIKVGKMVAYPVRHSSRMWMNYGRVEKVVEGELNPHPANREPGRSFRYREWLVEPHIKVQIGTKIWWDSTEPRKLKIVKVVKLDRVIVIPWVQFNEEDREFFGLQTTVSPPIILKYPLGG
jgi:hypothetical protein